LGVFLICGRAATWSIRFSLKRPALSPDGSERERSRARLNRAKSVVFSFTMNT
jgi:hypothetical protein